MTGGLLQIISSGKQDIYLTINPEITFFKKVFRRYTNFSTELNRIVSEQPCEYNNTVTYILNIGDCINRCYMEIELPNLAFSDSYIMNTTYINKKITVVNNLTNMKTKWTNYYTNLKGFVDIETNLYRQLHNLLASENITINALKDTVNRFNLLNKSAKDTYKNKLDAAVYNSINISGYINSITKMVTNGSTTDTMISITDIITQLNIMYNNMVTNLTYYNNKIMYYNNKLSSLSTDNVINFNFAEYLGHNYFDYFTLEIGGVEVTRYTNDILHINMLHSIKQDALPNYYEMIGHTPKLNTFNNNTKGNSKILVPLMFWFNKDTSSSLPLVALQYSTISITTKIKPLNDIVCFENYEAMYQSILVISTDAINGFNLNTKLLYTDYSFDMNNKLVNYICMFINDELLKLQFTDLTTDEINLLLTSVGTQYTLNQLTALLHPELDNTTIEMMNGINGSNTQYVINMYQWVSFMINITKPQYKTIAMKVASYYPYINFDQYYSMIPSPVVNMVVEAVYLDDVERGKFANSKLEYIVETFEQDIFTIQDKDLKSFDCELSFLHPSKELLWYVQPQLYIDGLTHYGQNISLLFDSMKYFTNTMIAKQTLKFNQLDVLLPNVDNNFYTYLLSYKYLNNILPNGIYYNSFSLYPEETQPSGVANLKEIKGKEYKINISSQFLTEYAQLLTTLYNNTNKLSVTLKFICKNYDLFVISKGQGKLLFTS